MTAAKDTVDLVVRLPAKLHAEVKADAERNERTIAGTIRYALRRYLTRSEA